MNGFSERDTVFLAEMGLGPLWRLRAAPVQAAAVQPDEGDVLVEEAPAVHADAAAAARPPAQAPVVTPPAPAPAPEQAWADEAPAAAPPPARPPLPPARPAPAEAARPPAPPAAPSAPSYLPPGPRPLQPVAQTVSALAPDDSAWDDTALPLEATPEEIAVMDWDQLGIAITTCRRCSACRDGRPPVTGTGARQARWLVAAGASTAADEKERLPLAGDPGKLLDNMLLAVGMSRQQDVYITNLIKCRPLSPTGAERAPSAEEAAACRPYLERELALTGAGTVMTLGQIAANTLLGRPLATPLAGVRGQVHALASVPGEVRLVASLHPGELLRRGTDKAQAWADLCRARAAGGASGGRPG
ncbi:uracil-DNA glycosylase [Herbaspirillum sp. SJZ107]|uniref:uracil-DNA glycosylase n=1 Tax=Herbaspirillum sp. SJZ107 TaxID=2572881 RepID=UPI0011524EA0|nr:uracil-DNA glycosylase [Herbaspirillum sp. SJZ107]TQK10888.1 DNA polymerase [Herbaspirillum sp. SJZ107]